MTNKVILVFTMAPVFFASAATAERASLAPIGPSTCFTLEETDDPCGKAAQGPSITCEDQTSGPGWIRIAPKTYKCVVCPQHQSGQRDCSNTAASVHETIRRYGCERGTYALVETKELSSCYQAELSGAECEG